MQDGIPSFDELPRLSGLDLAHAWGVFGADDDLGTVNLLTPARVRRAVQEVRTGEVINLDLPITEPSPPLYGRAPVEHRITALDRNARDDRVDALHPQGSTQWDGLRHLRCREYGFYGGITAEFEPGAGRLGMEHWARHGIAGRGVLLDVARYLAEVHGEDLRPGTARAVTAEEVVATASHQQVEVLPGDVLCVRVGWLAGYRVLDAAARERVAAGEAIAGLEGSEAMARLLWDWHVAALACDNPSVEVFPGDPAVGSLHRRTIPLLGLALGELFDFEELAHRCAAEPRWTFFFVSSPLHLPGGVGSPANALALR